jgi:mRNA-degrading endonuclease toxin of MazEF toxin-antitoxin module
VLTRDHAIDRLNEVFVVLATTNIRGLPTEVELGAADGMPRACVLNADHVASLGPEKCVLSASLRLEMSSIAAAIARQSERRNLLHRWAFRDQS